MALPSPEEFDDDEDDAQDDEEREREAFTEQARVAVEEIITRASTDDVRGVIRFAATRMYGPEVECESFGKVVEYLKGIFEDAYQAGIGEFDSKVEEPDEDAELAAILSKTDFQDFFIQVGEPKGAQRIVASQELVESATQSKLIQQRFGSIGDELISYFVQHPEKLREIDPDDFEKLMAAVFRNQGFDVTKTPRSKDGGFDLVLVQHSSIGAAMTLVDCKRYAATKKVGVEIVRGLYGVVEERKATKGMIVTTSFFTKGAVDFRDSLQYRLAFADFDDVKNFLEQWKR
jgi:hypothetical protein